MLFPGKVETAVERLLHMENVSIDVVNGISSDAVFTVSHDVKLVHIEKNVGCRKFCNFLISSNATLIINSGVYFNNFCSVNCLGYIEIGEDTLVGEGVKLYDHNHKYSYKSGKLLIEKADFTIGKIIIGKNCWLGSNVTILNNVEIGDNVIIGANCLIHKSIPSNSIVKHGEELIINSLN